MCTVGVAGYANSTGVWQGYGGGGGVYVCVSTCVYVRECVCVWLDTRIT